MTTSLIAVSFDPETEDKGGIAVIYLSPSGASRPSPFSWPPSKDLQRAIESWRRAIDEVPPTDLGRRLFELLVTQRANSVLANALKASQDSTRTLVAVSSGLDEMHALPFEILHDGAEFLSGGNRIVFRHVNDGSQIEPRTGDLKRFLVILAEPLSPPYEPWGHDEFAEGIKQFFENWQGVEFNLLKHASPAEVLSQLDAARTIKHPYDVLIVVAHGEKPTTTEDGSLVLESHSGQPDMLRAGAFAAALRGHHGCLVLLFSCRTATIDPRNPAAALAPRIMNSGPAGAVVAMQRWITVEAGLSICRQLLQSLRRNDDIFDAFKDGANAATHGGWEHGTPCLYARLPRYVFAEDGTDREEALCLRTLFTAPQPERTRFAISLPNFRMGVPASDYETLKSTGTMVIPNVPFKYPGATVSRRDVMAVQEIIALLGRLVPAEELRSRLTLLSDVELREAFEKDHYSHLFVLGSRSHQQSRSTLKRFSKDFELSYDDRWHIHDLRKNRTYSAQ